MLTAPRRYENHVMSSVMSLPIICQITENSFIYNC
jgi:hypothetical protein